MDKIITILGSTGSIGRQSIEVAVRNSIRVEAVSAHTSVDALERQARELKVKYAAMTDEASAKKLKERLSDTDIKVFEGASGLLSMLSVIESETVINALVGMSGLQPTVTALENGKRVALANKESLVIAGDIVMARARERGVEILPVDSEHSAIFQSMKSGSQKEVKRILLTASGGPFFGRTREELKSVTLEDTLAHPTWKMGKKITVDSATLMNKGFEVIEAAHLFGVTADRIRVLVHRESILHSAVEYIDNTVIGELSVPDMRMCVQYAVDYPERCESVADELDLVGLGSLTFREPDTEAFPLLALAFSAMAEGGAVPAVLNAADEVAVGAFLERRLSFVGIYDVVGETVARMSGRRADTVEELILADREARRIASELIAK